MLHSLYLPYTDLWRGDKAFSDLLVKHKVDFSERVVPTLNQLPGRIEAEISKLAVTESPWEFQGSEAAAWAGAIL